MRNRLTTLVSLIFFCGVLTAFGQTNEVAPDPELEKILGTLKGQEGTISLNGGMAKIDVPPNFVYLNPKQAETVLTVLWGNPPGNQTLGMLVPKDVSPADAKSWGIVITYDEDGYVKDDDADKINYDDLLKTMQKGLKEENAQRKKEGYPEMELVGWAAPPRYDRATHKLYWAKQLKFTGSPEDTLNYNIRILGRRGVLVLNSVASMSQLPAVEKDAQKVLSFVEFNDGHRYADFNPKVDKVAAYGIAALILGGIAAKTGIFKSILMLLVAAKKLVIMVIVGIGAFFKKLFGKKSE